MRIQQPELKAAAEALEQIGNLQGASAVRSAASRLDACEHEIERLLVDIDSLSQSLAGVRQGR